MKTIRRVDRVPISVLGRGLVLLVTIALLLAACEDGGGGAPAQETPATPSPSPTATLIAGQAVPLEDVEAIEQAVSGYFEALDAGDFETAKLHSVGDVRALAGWQGKVSDKAGPGGPRLAAVVLDSLEIVSVGGDTATVEIEGQLEESLFDPPSTDTKLVATDISGPVTVSRKNSAWLVADYQRDGQSLRRQVHTARGRQSQSGLLVGIVGLDVRKNGAVLVAELRNSSALEAVGQVARVITGSGRELKTNFPANFAEVVLGGRSKATVGFLFPKGDALKGGGFRFQIDFFLGCDPECDATPHFDFSVAVAR